MSVEFISFLENNQVKLFCYLICRRHTPSPSWHLPSYVTLKCFPSTLNWASKIYASLTFVTHSMHHALWWSEYHPSLPMSQTQITDRWPYTSWFDAVINKCHFFRCPSIVVWRHAHKSKSCLKSLMVVKSALSFAACHHQVCLGHYIVIPKEFKAFPVLPSIHYLLAEYIISTD